MRPRIPYRRALIRYAARVRRRIGARAIILYGSTARGTFGAGSDIDLLVIAEGLPENFLERIRLLDDLRDSTAPIEVIGYTPEEFSRMIDKPHPTALSAIEDGIVLHDDGFFEEMRRRFSEIRERMRIVRLEDGWEIYREK
ncbi:MAG: nucleotidyltransferase domain-containing protein [Candidatus Bathyarchaeia archaeon]|nr:nucleotidyltransferase domain-containing protein [Candidatus Bathyarchaeota archaeon]